MTTQKRNSVTRMAIHLGSTESSSLLLTGASGFIGRHFHASYGGLPFADAGGSIDLRQVDRLKAAVALARPTSVIHLAAQSSVASSFAHPDETYAVNFLGTLNLLTALRSIQFRGVFVYVSSADVYGAVGDAELPIKEVQGTRPRSPYAVSKVAVRGALLSVEPDGAVQSCSGSAFQSDWPWS